VALYGGWALNNMFTANGRLEWYRDNDGATTGQNANYYSVTGGLTITPIPNDPIFQWLKVRPELRYDYADQAVFSGGGTFTGNGNHDQFVGAIDVIMSF
jgi:hypothetical protein